MFIQTYRDEAPIRILVNGFAAAAEPGDTILSAIRRTEKHIQSICGGRDMCGTCRIAIAPDWLASLPPAGPRETRLLRVLKAGHPNHRLACQTVLSAAHDGLHCIPDPPPTRILQESPA
jgi:ferredoxin